MESLVIEQGSSSLLLQFEKQRKERQYHMPTHMVKLLSQGKTSEAMGVIFCNIEIKHERSIYHVISKDCDPDWYFDDKKEIAMKEKQDPLDLTVSAEDLGSLEDLLQNQPGEIKEIGFFQAEAGNTDFVAKQYQLNNLKPIDPLELWILNNANPTFADKYPNFTIWKDKGKWYSELFMRDSLISKKRTVVINTNGEDKNWSSLFWCVGIRIS